MNKLTPTKKTAVIITIFSIVALVSFFTHLSFLSVSLPLFIFYVLFLVNSFYSIRLFFGLIPPKIFHQGFIDGVLAIVYLILATNFHHPQVFAFFLAFFFIFGTAKYIFLLPIVKDHPRLLKRKMTANILGVLLGLGSLGMMLIGREMLGVWSIAIFFGIANIYMFFISPLYRLDSEW
jgi:hypothetical protein